jgi:hypothetical protein
MGPSQPVKAYLDEKAKATPMIDVTESTIHDYSTAFLFQYYTKGC